MEKKKIKEENEKLRKEIDFVAKRLGKINLCLGDCRIVSMKEKQLARDKIEKNKSAVQKAQEYHASNSWDANACETLIAEMSRQENGFDGILSLQENLLNIMESIKMCIEEIYEETGFEPKGKKKRKSKEEIIQKVKKKEPKKKEEVDEPEEEEEEIFGDEGLEFD
jgi:hypothetical protein